LESKGIGWHRLAGEDAPVEPEPRQAMPRQISVDSVALPESVSAPDDTLPEAPHGETAKACEVLEAVEGLSGKEMEAAAKSLNVSRATLYQARTILKRSPADVLWEVRQGRLSIAAAYKRVEKMKKAKSVQED
ncbi:MAG: hypothetical protein FWB82_05600, partial [Treponema sp.]|nr:hypothetical protein [Treponema sp.]